MRHGALRRVNLMLLLLLLDGSCAWHATATRPAALVPLRGLRAATTLPMAINPELFQELAFYDLAMEERVSALEAECTSLREAKAAVEAQLETKTQEVTKFVASVEQELNEARQSVKTLTSEVTAVKADLAERTEEVANLSVHLEAHTGATMRFKAEVAELKEALAAAQAATA